MGSLRHFPLPELIARHSLTAFVETGTGRGGSLAYAADTTLAPLYSCEIHPELYGAARDRFAADRRVSIANAPSSEVLSSSLLTLSRRPVLFWLDAHFPGADYNLAAYDDPSVPDGIRLPLVNELNLIRMLRPDHAARDVILIDDARIWLDTAGSVPFSNGLVPYALRHLCPSLRSIQFIYDLFGATHTITVDPADEGYIVLIPKEPPADG